jgi:flavodoxin
MKDDAAQVNIDSGSGKTLIVYLSRTNNTRAIAEIIGKYTGGALVALELEHPYSTNYEATVQQVVRENENGFLPPLKTVINSMESYAVVFVGFPTWGMKLPPPMKSFLMKYDLSGKTVVPFNTNGGYGVGTGFEMVKQLCKNSQVLEGFTMQGGSERDGKILVIKEEKALEADARVKQWLLKLKLIRH